MAGKEKGVEIVHIKFGTVFKHVICVDASKGLIYDNAEIHPIRLTSDNLRRCAGYRIEAKAEIRCELIRFARIL